MKDVGQYFDRLIEAHGSNPQALDYGSWKSQDMRFKMIAEAIDFSGKTVLDIGCGFADLKPFLDEWFENVRYGGIEASEKAVGIAKKKTRMITQAFWPSYKSFIDPACDIVVMNGVLYLQPYVEGLEMIDAAWEITKEVLIFDCQSIFSERKHANEFYRRPEEVLVSLQMLTPYITLRHEKAKHFFMVYLYREKV